MNNIEHLEICPLCDSRKHRPIIKKQGLGYSKCKECDLMYANPRPSEEQIMARIEMFGKMPAPSPQYLQDRVNFQNERVAIVKSFVSSGKILDFGSGDGSFVKAAVNAGLDCMGVEKSPSAAEFARKYYNIKVITDDVQDIASETGTFNAIVMWDVLEHLPTPLETCRSLVNLLASNGYIFVLTPHAKGISAAIKGSNWWSFGPHDHLCLFSARSAKFLFGKLGLFIKHFSTKNLVSWYPPQYEGKKSWISEQWEKLSFNKKFLKFISRFNLGDWILTVAQKS